MKKNTNKEWKDEDRWEHMSWCLRHGIKIYYKPVTMNEGVLVIEDNDKVYVGTEKYKSNNTLYAKKKYKNSPMVTWSERILQLYTIKYLEYNEH